MRPVWALQWNIFANCSRAVLLFWIICVFVCLVLLMLSHLFIAALWSPAGKGLISWLLLVKFIVFLLLFPCGILGQVWYLIVSFPDLCLLSYFQLHNNE